MGSVPAVMDASDKVKRGQSTFGDMLAYVLTFLTRVTGVERIIG